MAATYNYPSVCRPHRAIVVNAPAANTNPADTPLLRWLATRARSSAHGALEALAPVALPAADPTDAAALVACLGLLEMLRADDEVLLATILHALPAWQPRLAALEPAARSRVQALLDGQQAAEQVWMLHAGRAQHVRAEGLRRLLLALVRDLRVILILLARQLVRMRGAAALPEAERIALAQLSADIHAPLANRLGIWQLKWELEDLAFRFLQPDTYKRIARLLDEKRGDRERFIEDVKSRIRAALGDADIRADVAGRPKHIFSIWKKMQRKDVPFGELYDVRAVRVLVDDIATCYAALGVVHQLWPPVPTEFDDYIANPKGNQYRSLHTAVIGPEGRTVEVQIRTHEMHAHSELGVAAHWRYKEGVAAPASADTGFERKLAWMRQMLDRTETDGDDDALLAGLHTDLVEDRIYLLTPKGEVVDLPRGGTVLDFAYHVHTEVGHRCRGAKVNGRIVPLDFQPGTGDRVEILTAKTSEPRRDWLLAGNGFLASARSRDKVRAWFHKLDRARNLQAGRDVLERELKRLALHQSDLAPALTKFHLANLDELHVAVALGDIGPSQVARALHDHAQAQLRGESARAPTQRVEPKQRPARPSDRFIVEGVGNLLTQLARCCQPVAGDPIAGYLTRARGVSVHREGCVALQRLLARHPERLLPVEWGERDGASYSVDVLIRGLDRKNLLKDLANLIAQQGVHVLAVNSRMDAARGLVEMAFTLKVRDFDQLGQLLGRLNAVPGVDDVRRLG